jgi:hypothetical protein
MWVYSDFIDVYTKHGVLQHAATLSTNYNITIKVGVRWEYLLIATHVTADYNSNPGH